MLNPKQANCEQANHPMFLFPVRLGGVARPARRHYHGGGRVANTTETSVRRRAGPQTPTC